MENNISTGQTQGIWIQGDLEALVSRMRIEKQGGEAEGKANQQSSFFGSIPDDTLQQYFEAQSRRHQPKSNQHHLLEHLMREHRPHRQSCQAGQTRKEPSRGEPGTCAKMCALHLTARVRAHQPTKAGRHGASHRAQRTALS
jgi:hypothetical protein